MVESCSQDATIVDYVNIEAVHVSQIIMCMRFETLRFRYFFSNPVIFTKGWFPSIKRIVTYASAEFFCIVIG